MDDETKVKPDQSEADEQFGWTTEGAAADPAAGPAAGPGRDWLAQLQSMIENVAEQAAPVLREVSAKAAELAALAGEKAGPFAARAAELTAEAGTKLAERSRDLAAELRRDGAGQGSGATTPEEPTAAATSTGDATEG